MGTLNSDYSCYIALEQVPDWATVFLELLKILKKQWPKLRLFQPSSHRLITGTANTKSIFGTMGQTFSREVADVLHVPDVTYKTSKPA